MSHPKFVPDEWGTQSCGGLAGVPCEAVGGDEDDAGGGGELEAGGGDGRLLLRNVIAALGLGLGLSLRRLHLIEARG